MPSLEEMQQKLSALQTELSQMKAPHRLLHLQVAGSPSTDDLRNVALVFQQSLADGVDRAVPTNEKVTSRMFVVGDGPTSIMVKGCIDVEGVAAAAYAVLVGYRLMTKVKIASESWAALPVEQRQLFANAMLDYLNTGVIPPSWAGIEKLIKPVVAQLKTLLPIPDNEGLTVEVLGSEVMVENRGPFHQWNAVDLRQVEVGAMFRFPHDPAKKYVATSQAFINYGAVHGSAWSINTAEPPPNFVFWPDVPPEGQRIIDEEALHSEGVAQAESEPEPSELSGFYADAKGDLDVNVPLDYRDVDRTNEPAPSPSIHNDDLIGTTDGSAHMAVPGYVVDKVEHGIDHGNGSVADVIVTHYKKAELDGSLDDLAITKQGARPDDGYFSVAGLRAETREPANSQDASDLDGTVTDSYTEADEEPDLKDWPTKSKRPL